MGDDSLNGPAYGGARSVMQLGGCIWKWISGGFKMKFGNKVMAAAVVAAMTGISAQATVIDQGDITLDQNTGYQWLDLSFTVGQSYNYALGIADSQFGGGWVVATSAEVLAFWTSATGITSWPGLTWTSGLDAATSTLGALVGYTYEFNYEYSPGLFNTGKQIIGYHSGLINVDETNAGSLGLIVNANQPGQGYVEYKSNYYGPYGSAANRGTWLIRGDNIRPQAPSGDIDPDAVPEPSTLGLFGAGFMSLGFIGYGRRRRQRRSASFVTL